MIYLIQGRRSIMTEYCPRCNKDLKTVTEDSPCDDCAFIYDPMEPDITQELNFNEDGYDPYYTTKEDWEGELDMEDLDEDELL